MLDGAASDAQIASFLTAVAARGATVDELAGFVAGIRAASHPIVLSEQERSQLVDTVEPAATAWATFNISTAAALVAAAAGAKIAKHGNRGVTSRCGSADVLEALGISIELKPADAVDCMRQTGFMFLYAPALHPAMKRVQPVRRALGFPYHFQSGWAAHQPCGSARPGGGCF